MHYKPRLGDIRFILNHLCNISDITALPNFAEATPDLVDAMLDEAGRFATEVLAPLNRIGDQRGVKRQGHEVETAPGWKNAYETFIEMGWNGAAADQDIGGMGLPKVLNACFQDIFNGANTAFQLCPTLTQGAIEAIRAYANDALKTTYLPELVSGNWTGTMNLTEPQAGSDLAAIRATARPEGDHFLIVGQKIFITYGEHDLSENIVHLVLARLPDAPPGVKGISLFVVPKFLPGTGGNRNRNDLSCIAVEEKLGIHASPTCTMSFGDNGGAVGFLVGEEHQGLKYMFTMMNSARLGIGLQGIGLSEAASQHAAAYALERRQGRPPNPNDGQTIIGHPDVKRMLARMQSTTMSARTLAYRAAAAQDLSEHSADATQGARFRRRADLLTPIVKGWSTELAVENTSIGVQIHGGMGYVEETGAAQFLRDARITTIYEGTTGIQAIDLVCRKIRRDGGHAAGELIEDIRCSADRLLQNANDNPDARTLGQALIQRADDVEEVVKLLVADKTDAHLAIAVPVLIHLGTMLGAWVFADAYFNCLTLPDASMEPAARDRWRRMAKFYFAVELPKCDALLQIIRTGGDAISDLGAADFAA